MKSAVGGCSGYNICDSFFRPERTADPAAIVAAFENYNNRVSPDPVDGVKSKKCTPPIEIALFRQLIKGLKDIHTR